MFFQNLIYPFVAQVSVIPTNSMKRVFTNAVFAVGFFLAFNFTYTTSYAQLSNSSEKYFKRILKEAKERIRIEEYQEGLELFVMADSMKPNDGYINLNIGTCLRGMNKPIESIPYLEKALFLSKSADLDKEIYFFLADSYHMNHQFERALEYFTKYLEFLEPKTDEYYEMKQKLLICNYAKELAAAPVVDSFINLGAQINTAFPEYAAVLSADESVMIFTSRREGTTGGLYDYDNQYFEDIYISEKLNGAWTKPVPISPNVNTQTHDASVGLSADGTSLFIYRAENGGDLFESQQNGAEWLIPQRFVGDINSKYAESSCSVTPDGNILYFASNRPGGYGGFDLYQARKLPGEFGWAKAQNLGPTINTDEDEDGPFIHPDGRTLYFSSKGHKTMGGFDIFKTILDDGKWTSPVNIGFPINTAGDDIYFVLSADGKNGYYASSRTGGFGGKDIWKIRMPSSQKEVALTVLKGSVLEKKSGKPVSAEIMVTDNELRETVQIITSNSQTGKFLMVLPPGRNYGFVVDNPDFMFYSENIFIQDQSSFQAINMDIFLEKLEVGAEVILKNIFFDTGKSDLRDDSQKELENLFQLLAENPGVKVEIGGHTDNVGEEAKNERLSNDRALAVLKYLIEKGIEAERLTNTGYGSQFPVESNETQEGRQKNRRTVMKIISVN